MDNEFLFELFDNDSQVERSVDGKKYLYYKLDGVLYAMKVDFVNPGCKDVKCKCSYMTITKSGETYKNKGFHAINIFPNYDNHTLSQEFDMFIGGYYDQNDR